MISKFFKSLEKSWAICYNSICNHIYTIPWYFEHLNLLMLDENDLESICLNVKYLIVDKQKLHQFRSLKHLIIDNKELIFPFLSKHINKLTLSTRLEILNQSNIYLNVRHLIVKENEIDSLLKLKSRVKCFPNLNSIELKLNENNNCLNLLLDGEHLPYLFLLKTNWIGEYRYCSNIKIWLSAHTPLKYTPFSYYTNKENNCLTIDL
ncbi:hypothetical protein I4U23_031413 [Adineta vaga]|nr:hypothetical protein I4U23_031413 [Adineta vaga]